MDKDTERFFKSRMDLSAMQKSISTTPEITSSLEEVSVVPFRRLPLNEVKPFVNCVPLYDLKAAAGRFSDEQQVTELMQGKLEENIADIDWVELPDAFRPQRGLFIARVVGESMNRRIPNSSWCLFRLDPVGSRQGKIVLAQHRDIADADTGGHYTVKRYESTKTVLTDGTWRHVSIILRPDTTSPGYDPFIFNESEGADVR